jgi:hypothetical protein
VGRGRCVVSSLTGCNERGPGLEDCDEWRERFVVRLQGELRMSYSGRQSGTSPNVNYQPVGWHDGEVAHVYGCALDADDNLWRLRTYWGFPPAPPPYDVVLNSEEDDMMTVGTFAGDGVMCKAGDCAAPNGLIAVLDSDLRAKPGNGRGRVTEWSLGPARLKSEVTVHPPIMFASGDAVITVDVTWPEN